MRLRAWVFWRPACRADEARITREGDLTATDEAEWTVAREERAALVLARAVAGEAVEVISWAPAEAEPVLRQALALGARRVWRVASPALNEDDVVGTARGLVAARDVAMARTATDDATSGAETGELWFFGAGSLDYNRGAVGPAVAGILGCRLFTGMTDAAGPAGFLAKEEQPVATVAALPGAVGAHRQAAVIIVGRGAPQPPKPNVLALARVAGRAVETIALPSEAGAAASVTIRVTERESIVPRRRLGEVLPEDPEEAVHLLLARLRERRAF